ncbi:MAG: site-specific DNA-methyltransferase [Caldilineaceae bacterium]|nr:site-specific DNA-methyltransferase [Caldilineaceae bacterium]
MTEAAISLCAAERDGPTLTWPEKRLSVCVDVPILRTVEAYGDGSAPNLLLHGDNALTLAWLLANGYRQKIRLIYIDPPFDSDGDYTSVVRLRGDGAKVIGSRVQYRDRWQGGDYLQFMVERLLLLKELLHPDGTIWLHCDHRASARLQLVMEEIFGAESYLNTIAWRSQVARGAKVHARYFPRSTHSIHIFAASPQGTPTWHPPRKEIVMSRAEAAAHYMEDERGFFRTSHPGTYSFEKLVQLHAQGRIYAPHGGNVIVDEANRRVYASNGGNIGVKYYVEQRGEDRFFVTRAVDNLWDDIPGLGTIPSEDVNYPTQKTEGLLQRIIETSSDPGDLILDAFVGSGTSVRVAQQLDRRWIGCDDNWGAIRTTARRVGGAKKGSREEERERGVEVWQAGGATVPTAEAEMNLRVDMVAGGSVQIRVEGYRSAALIEQLRVAGKEIPVDWRAGVQSVAIDPDYDEQIFRPQIIDAPRGRAALVAGRYSVPITKRSIAVQIVDVLGDECIHVFSPL